MVCMPLALRGASFGKTRDQVFDKRQKEVTEGFSIREINVQVFIAFLNTYFFALLTVNFDMICHASGITSDIYRKL